MKFFFCWLKTAQYYACYSFYYVIGSNLGFGEGMEGDGEVFSVLSVVEATRIKFNRGNI